MRCGVGYGKKLKSLPRGPGKNLAPPNGGAAGLKYGVKSFNFWLILLEESEILPRLEPEREEPPERVKKSVPEDKLKS